MPNLKTCLLISDDPDDHFEFSEALQDTSSDMVLISVFESRKIVDLLKNRRILPDYVFLDLSMSEPNQGQIAELLRSDTNYKGIKLVTYGNDSGAYIPTMLGKDYSYKELKEFLKQILFSNTDGKSDDH